MPLRGTTEDEKFTLCHSASAWGTGTHPGLKRRGIGRTHGIAIFIAVPHALRGTTEDEKFTVCPSASAWGTGTHPGLKRRGIGRTHGIAIFIAETQRAQRQSDRNKKTLLSRRLRGQIRDERSSRRLAWPHRPMACLFEEDSHRSSRAPGLTTGEAMIQLSRITRRELTRFRYFEEIGKDGDESEGNRTVE